MLQTACLFAQVQEHQQQHRAHTPRRPSPKVFKAMVSQGFLVIPPWCVCGPAIEAAAFKPCSLLPAAQIEQRSMRKSTRLECSSLNSRTPAGEIWPAHRLDGQARLACASGSDLAAKVASASCTSAFFASTHSVSYHLLADVGLRLNDMRSFCSF